MSYGLGLDTSTKVTGWFIYHDQPLPSGALGGQGGVIKADDWVAMAIMVEAFIIALDPAPTWVAIEDTYLNQNAQKQAINPQTRKLLDRLAGAVIVATHKHLPQAKVYQGTAAEINAACGIPAFLDRASRKKQLKAFAEMLGFVLPQDACDALGCAHWGAGQARRDAWLQTSQGSE